MLVLLRILVGFFCVVAVLAGIGLALPREVELERSVLVAAPPAAVFPYLNDLRKFAEWSPWQGLDPDMTQSFSGPESGVGARMTWSSDTIGDGSQEITMSEPDTRVESALDFGAGDATAWQALVPYEGGTRVTWGFATDLGMNPAARWFGLLFERWIGADYERGLAALKALVETRS